MDVEKEPFLVSAVAALGERARKGSLERRSFGGDRGPNLQRFEPAMVVVVVCYA